MLNLYGLILIFEKTIERQYSFIINLMNCEEMNSLGDEV